MDFPDEGVDFPGGAVGGIVEENEPAGQQVAVNVFKVALALVVAVIAVYVCESDGAAKASWAIVYVGGLGFFSPELEELVAGAFNGVGEIMSAECGGVLVE